MKVRLGWTRNTYGESEFRIYRDTSPLDPNNLPVPIATVGAGVTTWDDTSVVDQTTYYYLVAAVYQGTEYKSVVFEKVVDGVDAAVNDTFDSFDLTGTPDTYDVQVASHGAEIVAAIRDGAIAESTTQVSALTDYGQHKWPHTLTQPIGRMWVLVRDNVSGDVLRVYAERDVSAGPNVVISEAATWTFEALWQGQLYTGTGTWELSDNMGGQDFTSATSLSGDDGSFAFKDGANTQGNQSRPSGNVFGAGNWNSGDSSANMNVLGDNYSDFQGIVIFAPSIA